MNTKSLQRIMCNAERSHYNTLFKENVSNIRKSWEIFKEILKRGKSSDMKPSKFFVNYAELRDSTAISNSFHDYFVNIGPKLSSFIPSSNCNNEFYMPNNDASSLFLTPSSSDEIARIIKELQNKSPEYDGIHTKVVRGTHLQISRPLTHIMSISFRQGIFPKELKVARVTPVYKGKKCKEMANYRPVSVLPVFSKIFECLMYKRLYSFINKHNLLYQYQFGFRNGYGTNLALITLIDKVACALEDGRFVLGVFLDFSKAFDTMNHAILLRKLYKYVIRGAAFTWMTSYLSNRLQYVNYNNVSSCAKNITCGVPQGSILVPLLFLIYVNDIVNVSPSLTPILFADGTNIFIEGTNINEVIVKMSTEMVREMD